MSDSAAPEPSLMRAMIRARAVLTCGAVGLWVVDCGWLLPSSASALRAAERILSCWAWVLVCAVPLTLLLGVLAYVASLPLADGSGAPGRSAGERLRAAALGGGIGSSALILTLWLDAALLAGATRVVAAAVVPRMEQVRFIALALALLTTLVAAAVALLHLPLQAVVARLLATLARVPKLGTVLRRPGLLLSGLVGLALVLAAAVVALRWEEAQYLAWATAGRAALALGLGATLLHTWSRVATPGAARMVMRTLAVFSAASVAVAPSLDGDVTDTASIVRLEALSGSAGDALLLGLFDADGDGYLPSLGGDCAPSDPRVNPGAIELIGNGVDEDCDGKDAATAPPIPRAKYAYRLPKTLRKPAQIFLITIDALQYHRLFAKDTKKPVMPNLDAFARRSVYFTDAFSPGPATRNAFPSIFTSRWDCQIGHLPGRNSPAGIEPRELMLAETMKKAGFATLAVLPNVYFFPRLWKGLTDGFDIRVEIPGTSRKKSGIHNANMVTRAAIDALAPYDRSAELFAWVHYFDAHAPISKVTDNGIGPWGDDAQSRYNSEVEFVDQQLGRLLQAIDAHEFSEPIVIITADHGTSFSLDTGLRDPKVLSSEILHVPLVINARFLPPRRVQTLVSTMDIAPTLANLLRLRRGLPYEGVSLVPELTTGKPAAPRYVHHELWAPERSAKGRDPLTRVSLRSERYHLVHDREHREWSLFEWRKDPREKHDLMREPAHRRQRRKLQQSLAGLVGEICGRSLQDAAAAEASAASAE